MMFVREFVCLCFLVLSIECLSIRHSLKLPKPDDYDVILNQRSKLHQSKHDGQEERIRVTVVEKPLEKVREKKNEQIGTGSAVEFKQSERKLDGNVDLGSYTGAKGKGKWQTHLGEEREKAAETKAGTEVKLKSRFNGLENTEKDATTKMEVEVEQTLREEEKSKTEEKPNFDYEAGRVINMDVNLPGRNESNLEDEIEPKMEVKEEWQAKPHSRAIATAEVNVEMRPLLEKRGLQQGPSFDRLRPRNPLDSGISALEPVFTVLSEICQNSMRSQDGWDGRSTVPKKFNQMLDEENYGSPSRRDLELKRRIKEKIKSKNMNTASSKGRWSTKFENDGHWDGRSAAPSEMKHMIEDNNYGNSVRRADPELKKRLNEKKKSKTWDGKSVAASEMKRMIEDDNYGKPARRADPVLRNKATKNALKNRMRPDWVDDSEEHREDVSVDE